MWLGNTSVWKPGLHINIQKYTNICEYTQIYININKFAQIGVFDAVRLRANTLIKTWSKTIGKTKKNKKTKECWKKHQKNIVKNQKNKKNKVFYDYGNLTSDGHASQRHNRKKLWFFWFFWFFTMFFWCFFQHSLVFLVFLEILEGFTIYFILSFSALRERTDLHSYFLAQSRTVDK